MRLIAGILALGLLAGCATESSPTPAPAQQASAAANPDAAKPASGPKVEDPNKKVCRSERQLGSNMPSRTCHTAAEWAQIDRQGLEGIDAFKRDIQSSTGVSPQ